MIRSLSLSHVADDGDQEREREAEASLSFADGSLLTAEVHDESGRGRQRCGSQIANGWKCDVFDEGKNGSTLTKK